MTEIKRRRLECGLSQKRLAEKVGVSAFTVKNWEDGRFRPSEKHLSALSEALKRILLKKMAFIIQLSVVWNWGATSLVGKPGRKSGGPLECLKGGFTRKKSGTKSFLNLRTRESFGM